MDDQLYGVEFSQRATKEFLDLEREVQVRIKSKVDALREDPRPRGCEKLSGFKNAFRVRVGDYRVVYAVNDELGILTVTRIAHRSVAYRGL